MPQVDHTGKLAVSLYGKGTVAGDTALTVHTDGSLATFPTAEAISLRVSNALVTPVVDGLGTAVTTCSKWKRLIILLNVTNADTEISDTLDVYVDVSLDGSVWLNAVHFTQVVGTDSATKLFAILDPSAPGTSVINATSDASAGVVRPSLWGPQMRARWTLVDGGGTAPSFTFGVTAYGQG